MSRELARLTEWAWTQGRLEGEVSLLNFSLQYYQFLRTQYASTEFTVENADQRSHALCEIFNDVCHYLRLLKYGGTKPASRHPKRIEWLATEPSIVDFRSFLLLKWSLPK
ncbi:MAG TPA: hypothetical protein VM901_06635 [Bdellovibrionota bacterium]|jgi:hypothetical protein|nr:hypothetical protein [Bdellovibrionota bacterium]